MNFAGGDLTVSKGKAKEVPSVVKSGDQEVPALTESLERTNLSDTLTVDFIDTYSALPNLMDRLIDLPSSPPSLFVDLEGAKLSRHGTISILQLYDASSNCVYLIDIHTLGKQAFSTSGARGKTLKGILEDSAIPKVFFDVRNDSDALFHHFQINLAGVQDLHLMELATQKHPRRFVIGLSKCIERHAPMTETEKVTWKAAKETGLELFAPERGGTYEVFNMRPLSEQIKLYCVQDVQFLPGLWAYYGRKITPKWARKVEQATKDRVAQSQGPDYNSNGRHQALAPKGWS